MSLSSFCYQAVPHDGCSLLAGGWAVGRLGGPVCLALHREG